MRWRNRRGERFWAATTPRVRVVFALGVFFTFAALAILLDVQRKVHPPLGWLALYAAISGLVAVTYAFAFLRDWRLVPIALALQIVVSWLSAWATAPGRGIELSAAAMPRRLTIDAIACFAGVAFGYAFMVRSIHGLARGHAVLHTEVELARGIHDALAPPVAGRAGRIEYYGRSQPSGVIGGDLVDAVEHADGLVLYVVDVSGHGIQAAVLMAMLKSAARTALAGGADLPALLAHSTAPSASSTGPRSSPPVRLWRSIARDRSATRWPATRRCCCVAPPVRCAS